VGSAFLFDEKARSKPNHVNKKEGRKKFAFLNIIYLVHTVGP